MTKTVLRLLPLLIAAAFANPAVAAPAPKKPAVAARPAPAAGKDWTQVATRTAAGDFVQGNPNAKVKLVEYLSFTCPHCAAFDAEASGPLAQKYIRTGQVSYEVRIALRDGYDLAAALLSRCSGPRPFFSVKPAVFAAQADWELQGAKWAQTATGLDKLAEADVPKVLAAGAGLDTFFAKHGLPKARADACLADAAEQKRLSDAAQAIWTPDFPGTPLFEINGTRQPDVHSWAELEPKLRAAIG